MEKRLNKLLKREKKLKEVMDLLAPHVHPSRLSGAAEDLVAQFQVDRQLPHNRNKKKMEWAEFIALITTKVTPNA